MMIWSAVLVGALTLAASDSGALRITNMRATYGVGGPDRPDKKVLPGDTLVIAYDIEGMQPGADGKVHYRIGMEVSDQKRGIQLKQEPKPKTVPAAPDGRPLAAVATLHVGLDQPPGMYTVKLTITDDTSRATGQTSQTYEVLPKDFGLVRVTADGDPTSKALDPFFQAGKPGVINFTVVGFERRHSSGQPDVRVTMVVLRDGQSVLERPTVVEVKNDVPPKALAVPIELRLRLAKAGPYTVRLTAKDRVTGHNFSISLPITVASK
jgi:hypothetical protein